MSTLTSPKTKPKKKIYRLLLLTLLCVAAVAIYQIALQPMLGHKTAGIRTAWRFDGKTYPQAAALGTGECLLIHQTQDGKQISLLDTDGSTVWSEHLPNDVGGAAANTSGLLVYGPDYVQYYSRRGCAWSWTADSQISTAFVAGEGGAVLACARPASDSGLDPDALFAETLVYLDAAGRKVWEKHSDNRAMMDAKATPDARKILVTSFEAVAEAQVVMSVFGHDGALLAEVRGEGGVFSSSMLSDDGELAVSGMATRLTGVTSAGKWYYQLGGELRCVSLGRSLDTVCLLAPARAPVASTLFKRPTLLAVTKDGAKRWERRLAHTAYAAWTDEESGITIVGTKDGICAYDALGKRIWQKQTEMRISGLQFWPDGSFLCSTNEGHLIRYTQ